MDREMEAIPLTRAQRHAAPTSRWDRWAADLQVFEAPAPLSWTTWWAARVSIPAPWD